MEYAELLERFRSGSDTDARMADAVAAHEVRKIRWAIEATRSGSERDWAKASQLIDEVAPYANECGLEVCREAVAAAGAILDYTRWGLPDDMARRTTNIVVLALFSGGFHRVDVEEKVPPQQRELAGEAVGRAWSLVWDGTRYLKDIRVVYEGVQVMLVVLHWSRANKIGDLADRILQYLSHAREMAIEKKLPRVVALFDWATSGDENELKQSCDLPEQLSKLIFNG